MGRIAQETAKGLTWTALQKLTLQPVQFIYGIILARLLSPAEMGIVGLTAIFFAIAACLQNSGLGAALIRKQNRTEADCSTVFWCNVCFSFILSSSLFFAAPYFAVFFGQPALTGLTRVSSLMLFLNSTAGVHLALYNARRNFKTPAIIGACSSIIPMPFSVWAAYSGWSYWSIIVQSTISGFISLIAIWVLSPWKPRFTWSRTSFIDFFSFGIKLTGSGLLTTFYSEIRTFIIGRVYSPAQLGFFSKGYHTCSMPLKLVQDVMGGITYPILTTLQDEPKKLVSVYRRYIRLTALVVEGALITLAANSYAFTVTLYGQQWASAAVYAQILCFGIMLDPLSNINSNLYNVLGRTDITLYKEVILRVVGLPAIFIGASISVEAVCYSAVLIGAFAFFISIYLTSRVCGLRCIEQICDFLPYLILALLANIPAYLLRYTALPPWSCLLLGTSSSFCLYVLGLAICKDGEALYLYHFFLQSKIGKLLFKLRYHLIYIIK